MYIPIYKWAPGAAFVHGPQGRHQNETVELNELLSSVTGRGGWGGNETQESRPIQV